MKQDIATDRTRVHLAEPVELHDFEPAPDDIRAEVLAGLSKPAKTLPCKFFYDERGSNLFDRICELPEYYPTRTELKVMRDHAGAIADAVGPDALIVEYGSGSSLKTRVLLDDLRDVAGYVPIDISRTHLLNAARTLVERYPGLSIRPVCADYTRPFALPEFANAASAKVVAYFPGSTIGNFGPDDALAFLKSIRATCGRESELLIGVDLIKDPNILHAAYNDAEEVTAEFNRNLLHRINDDLGADFEPDAFAHYAFFNPSASRMEMHLVSRRSQRVSLGRGVVVPFAAGESIHTESCHKYTVETFASFAARAGYRQKEVWTDPCGWFSIQRLV